MCNRYQLRASVQQLRQDFGVTRERFESVPPAEFFSGSTVPIIRAAEGGANWRASSGVSRWRSTA